MVEIGLFVLVLAIVFGVKAASIMLTRDELVADGASFCWMKANPEDAEPAWTQEAQESVVAKRASTVPVHAYGRRPRMA